MDDTNSTAAARTDRVKLQALIHAQSIDGNKSFWSATLETLGMADGGQTRAHDIVEESLDDAVAALQIMMHEQQLLDNHHVKWTFPHTPFGDFHATPTDLLAAFAKWAREKENVKATTVSSAATNSTATAPVPMDWTKIRINASKAFRRLSSYADWIDDQVTNSKLGLFDQPLDVAHLDYATVVALASKVSHDQHGRIVWWIDLAAMDVTAIQSRHISVTNLIRYMVWLAHLLLFDVGAQDYGLVFVENMTHANFFKLATLVPMDASAARDKLIMGLLPLKLQQMVVLGADRWMHVVMALFKPFMSQKLRQRIRMMGRTEDVQAVCADILGGLDFVLPDSFCGVHNGRCTKELIFGTFFAEQYQAAAAEVQAKKPADTATAMDEEATC